MCCIKALWRGVCVRENTHILIYTLHVNLMKYITCSISFFYLHPYSNEWECSPKLSQCYWILFIFYNDIIHTFHIIWAIKAVITFSSLCIYQNLHSPPSSPFLLVEMCVCFPTCANNLFFLPWWERQWSTIRDLETIFCCLLLEWGDREKK